MNEKTQNRRRHVRAVGLALAVVFLLGVLVPPLESQAAPSLPHIQDILSAGGVFNILEILPDERAGSLGYYIGGQEPVRNWKEELSKITGRTLRTARANEILSGLTVAGLLSGGSDTPLTLTAAYDEKMLWETVPAGYERLTLAAEEQALVQGAMTPADNGAYRERFEYQLKKDGTERYSQDIVKFEYAASAEAAAAYAGTWFYRPVFVLLQESDDLNTMAQTALYRLVDGVYTYIGTPQSLGGIELGQEYYYAQANPEPFESYSAEHPYAALANGYKMVADGERGYFSRTATGFVQVGTGGTHNFAPGGTAQVSISYQQVYITGGYRNNSWFLKSVLDMTDADIANPTVRRPELLVRTVRASNVTEAMVRSAGLVVLSNGCKAVPNTYAEYTDNTGANALSEAAALAVYNEAADGLPVLIDHRLMDESQPCARLKKLIRLCLRDPAERVPVMGIGFDAIGSVTEPAELTSDADKSFVKNNALCLRAPFATGTGKTLQGIATQHFAAPMASAVYGDGFSAVFSEIQSENFLRKIDGTQQLPELVTLANALRYIINYAGQRVVTAKDSLHVLEIQPAKTTSPLTSATVSGWSGIPANKITVKTMTSAEFAGRIEDINEVYDAVYIGSDQAYLNYNGIKNGVGGRAYNAIGDTVRTNLNMAGLLNRDYFNGNPGYNASDVPTAPIDGRSNYSGVTSDANLMRFSGNDITKSRATDLINFAKAGYPVILANELTVLDATNQTGSGIAVNTAKVDSSSYFYEAMKEMVKRANVLKQSDAAAMKPYLLVSKPEIQMVSMPPVYEENGPTLTSGVLTYEFVIENQTDPTPRETTYDCRLSIDLNADGRYALNEAITDIEVLRDGNVVDTVDGVYRLTAGVRYTVNRQMPQGVAGIIPWKLTVIKNGSGNEHIHASVQENTRIRPETRKMIQVLQIVQTGADRLNLASNSIYRQYINDLKDFDIRLSAVDTSSLAAMGDENSIYAYLDGYDMLIIGFSDTYGGISQNSALAIRRFIDSKKSVLFSHDTTSFYALPNSNYPRWTGGTTGGVQMDVGTGWRFVNATRISESASAVSFSLQAANRAAVYKELTLDAGTYVFSFTKSPNAHVAVTGAGVNLSDASSGARFTLNSRTAVTFTITSDNEAQATVSAMQLSKQTALSGTIGTGWIVGGAASALTETDNSVSFVLPAGQTGAGVVTNAVTLPAGDYELSFTASDVAVAVSGARVTNISGGTSPISFRVTAQSTVNVEARALASGSVSLSDITLRRVTTVNTTSNLGTGWEFEGDAEDGAQTATSVSFTVSGWLIFSRTGTAVRAYTAPTDGEYTFRFGSKSADAIIRVNGTAVSGTSYTLSARQGDQIVISVSATSEWLTDAYPWVDGMTVTGPQKTYATAPSLSSRWTAIGATITAQGSSRVVFSRISSAPEGSATRLLTGFAAGTYVLEYDTLSRLGQLTVNGVAAAAQSTYFNVAGDGAVSLVLSGGPNTASVEQTVSLAGLSLARVPETGWSNQDNEGLDWVYVTKNRTARRYLWLEAGSYEFDYSQTNCTVSVSGDNVTQDGATAQGGVAFTVSEGSTVTLRATARNTNSTKLVSDMRIRKKVIRNEEIALTGWLPLNVTNFTQSTGSVSFQNNITPVAGSAVRTLTNLTAGKEYVLSVTNNDTTVTVEINGVRVAGSVRFTATGRDEITISGKNYSGTGVKTVSVSNLRLTSTDAQPANVRYDIGSGWGYYFNTVIRDAVGLDRYGVTSKSLLDSGLSLKSVVRAGGVSVKENEQSILRAGRGVAYAPDTAKAAATEEAQGYTNYTLKRYTNADALSSNSSPDAGLSSSQLVSQVNKGQITTYPYDINLGSFSKTPGKSDYMDVMSTHDQYFQLNMNADDVVVWYCLSGGNFAAMPNDVTNAYYIFNKGNVTYTGVGHFTSTVTADTEAFRNEAKLFINTMIAAYQAGAQVPTVEIRDPESTGYKLDTMYFVSDDYAQMGTTFGTSREVLFKINDPNLSGEKTTTVKFFYTNAAGSEVAFTPLGGEVRFGSAGSVSASSNSFRGNVLYRFTLPDEVLGENGLGNKDIAKITVGVRVTTTVGAAPPLLAEASVELIKIGLFDLK